MDELIHPGEYMVIRVQFPKDLDISEACSIELFFDDFRKSLVHDWEILLVGKE